ncbi:DUF5683 domain-containing protein [Leptospira sp. 96542]|nr:DUF5683 domain-containing protein [Leptospira sp. 96542]
MWRLIQLKVLNNIQTIENPLKLRSILQSIIAIVLLSFVFPIQAESILLKKGGTIKGKVVEQDQNKIKVKKEDGSFQTISKADILKVVYKENMTAAEEEKLRKAEEDKERIKREKEEAARQKKEQEEAAKAEKANQAKKAEEEAALKKQQEEKNRLAAEAKKNLTPLGAAWRSAVLPGWGQWQQGRKTQAIVYPSIILVGLFFTYDKHRMYQSAKRDYNNLENPYTENGLIRAALTPPNTPALSPGEAVVASQFGPFKGQRESVERHYREMQYIGLATALVYFWNVFDAYYFHPKQNLTGGEDSKTNKIFVRTSVERMFGAPPTSLAAEKGFEHRTNLGYEFYF